MNIYWGIAVCQEHQIKAEAMHLHAFRMQSSHWEASVFSLIVEKVVGIQVERPGIYKF